VAVNQRHGLSQNRRRLSFPIHLLPLQQSLKDM
jgi:hypothetical protein